MSNIVVEIRFVLVIVVFLVFCLVFNEMFVD